MSDLFLLSGNRVAANAIDRFVLQCDKINNSEQRRLFSELNTQIFNLLTWLSLDDLSISITSSESIFYRFKVSDSDFDFMWEAFLDYDGEGNFGSTLQVYKNDVKYKSTFGEVDYIYETVNEIAFQGEENMHPFEFYDL
jgi:hypothetical protein